MEIKKDIRNELFKRSEISFKTDSEKNPGFEEMRKKISEQLKKPEENIDVYNIKGNFGLKQFSIDAYVYDSKEDLKKAEQKTQKQRKTDLDKTKKADEETSKEEKTKTEETFAEVPAEENPVEESAESSAEEKPEEIKE